MNKKLSFDIEASDNFSDCDVEGAETKAPVNENDKDEEEEDKNFTNINLI